MLFSLILFIFIHSWYSSIISKIHYNDTNESECPLVLCLVCVCGGETRWRDDRKSNIKIPFLVKYRSFWKRNVLCTNGRTAKTKWERGVILHINSDDHKLKFWFLWCRQIRTNWRSKEERLGAQTEGSAQNGRIWNDYYYIRRHKWRKAAADRFTQDKKGNN